MTHQSSRNRQNIDSQRQQNSTLKTLQTLTLHPSNNHSNSITDFTKLKIKSSFQDSLSNFCQKNGTGDGRRP